MTSARLMMPRPAAARAIACSPLREPGGRSDQPDSRTSTCASTHYAVVRLGPGAGLRIRLVAKAQPGRCTARSNWWCPPHAPLPPSPCTSFALVCNVPITGFAAFTSSVSQRGLLSLVPGHPGPGGGPCVGLGGGIIARSRNFSDSRHRQGVPPDLHAHIRQDNSPPISRESHRPIQCLFLPERSCSFGRCARDPHLRVCVPVREAGPSPSSRLRTPDPRLSTSSGALLTVTPARVALCSGGDILSGSSRNPVAFRACEWGLGPRRSSASRFGAQWKI